MILWQQTQSWSSISKIANPTIRPPTLICVLWRCRAPRTARSPTAWKRMVTILNFMGRIRHWIYIPAQSRIHEFQEMTLNLALFWISIRGFMIDSTNNIPGTNMIQKRLQVMVMLEMKASESWQAILPEMSLRIYPRVKTLAINKSRFSRFVLQRRKVRIISTFEEGARNTSANQPWTRLIWILNFRLLSAFIVPVTLSRDDNYSGGHVVIVSR